MLRSVLCSSSVVSESMGGGCMVCRIVLLRGQVYTPMCTSASLWVIPIYPYYISDDSWKERKEKKTLRTPRRQFADMWSFPFVGISLASSGSRIDIDKTCFEGKYPKNLCIGCFSIPFCIVGTGGLCSKLDIRKKGRSEPNS